MRLLSRLALLVVLWLLAWGDASLANVASGLLVGGGLLVAFPLARRSDHRLRLRPVGVARLVLYVVAQLVTSNVLVAREIVSRRSRVRSGVVAYPVRHPSDEVVTLVANILSLAPGTMTVEATTDPTVLYVHFLLLDDVDAARRAVGRLEQLVVGAIGVPPDPSGAEPHPKEPA